uniref:IPT/TIG domain-containing protein n=1 Tax=Pyramimonas obovata TaxID=1411642 RepID=A0A7S0R613_9CHLO
MTALSEVSTAGGVLTITGTSFGPLGNEFLPTVITVGTMDCVNPSVTVAHTEIQCTLPPSTDVSQTVTFTVDGQSAGPATMLYSTAPPVITEVPSIGTNHMVPVNPFLGAEANANITGSGPFLVINGTNFGFQNDTVVVLVDSFNCTDAYVTVANTEIQCQLGTTSGSGTGNAAGYNVTVTLGNGLSYTLSNGFKYLQPNVTSVVGDTDFFGNQTITIYGENFGCPTSAPTNCVLPVDNVIERSVTIGGASATDVVVVSHSQITAVTPPYDENAADDILNLPFIVTVEGVEGIHYTFSYGRPTITAVSEASIFGGVVTVTGDNFGPLGSAEIDEVNVGGNILDLNVALPSVTLLTDGKGSEIQFTIPQGSGSQLNLTITINGQSTLDDGHLKISYTGPRIESSIGCSTAGGTVTILGRNFGPLGSNNINLVTINSKPCTSAKVIEENKALTCEFTEGSGGPYDIFLRISDLPDIGVALYNYSVPLIFGITPLDAPPGSTITITGDSFGADISAVSVSIGDIPCESIAYNNNTEVVASGEIMFHTQLLCDTAYTTGAGYAVRITTDGLTSAPGSFSFSAPIVYSATSAPAAGSATARTITITGQYFGPAFSALTTEVTLGSSPCLNATVIEEDSTVICTAQPMLTIANGGSYALEDLQGDGLMDVVVFVGGQGSGSTGADKFSFEQCQVTAVTPLDTVYYTELVTVTGTNFGTAAGALTAQVGQVSGGTYTFTVPDNEFTFEAPLNIGLNLPLQISINGRVCGMASGTDTLSYGTPEVSPDASNSLTGPPTNGGVATFVGKGFGPVGTANVVSVMVDTNTLCREPNVTTADLVIQCTMPAGFGANRDVVVTLITGQNSGTTGDRAFAYAPPVIQDTVPNQQLRRLPFPQYLYIFGHNFGSEANVNEIVVMLESSFMSGVANSGFNCTNTEFVAFAPSQETQQIRCQIGVGVGNSVNPVVYISGLNSSAVSPVGNLSYPTPVITSVSPSSTPGLDVNGPVIIKGNYFGPAGTMWSPFFESNPLLGGQECIDPQVVVDDTEIACLPPAGSGKELNALVVMGGLSSGASGNYKFSYLPPVVNTMSSLPTGGGQTTIRGENFGPAFGNVSLVIYTSENCPPGLPPADFYGDTGCTPVRGVGNCLGARVVSDNVITCLMEPGTGGNYDVRVTIGRGAEAQDSGVTGNNKFGYRRPVVTALSPTVEPTFGAESVMITITGFNFGRSPLDVPLVQVSVGGRLADQSTIRMVNLDTTADAQSEIYAKPPFGAGLELPVLVIVNGQASEALPFATFSYSAPVVTGSTLVPTQGGETTITGVNFGPVGPLFAVEVAGEPCQNPQVIVEDTQLACQVAPGTGKDKDIFVKITNSSSSNSADTGVAKFAYMVPTIVDVQPLLAKTGETITVRGENFGAEVSKLGLQIGYPAGLAQTGFWTAVEYRMLTNHRRFVATIPAGFGTNLEIVVNIDGQVNNRTALTTPYQFSYSAPLVTSANQVPTSGGRLIVTGKDLGPIDVPGAVTSVQVRLWTSSSLPGRILDCVNPVVTVANSEVQCDLPEGTGAGLDVQVVTGGQESTWETVFSYEPPVIENVIPVRARAGERVTVHGRNFGNEKQFMQFLFGGEALSRDLYDIATNHTMIEFTVPPGSGAQISLGLRLPVYFQSGLTTQDNIPVIPGPNASVTFNYAKPLVLEVTPSGTEGGMVTIVGDNFGPAGSPFLESVRIGGVACTTPNVTVENTEIQCLLQAGSGRDLPVIITVNGQASDPWPHYQYLPPVVQQIRPGSAFAGDDVEIEGLSFGVNPGLVMVMLGQMPCGQVAMVIPHRKVRCTVGASEGFNQTVVLTVDGLQGDNNTAVRFAYRKRGCTDRAAENFDPLATDDIGDCRIMGCTQQEAVNYNPAANQPDGSCVRAPEVVTVKVALDFAVYSANASYYNNLFVTDVSTQLGINSSRIVIDSVTPGSTVFLFQILDDPESPAQDVAVKFENMLLNNEWNMDTFTVQQFKWADSTGPGTVDTKAGEPRVSSASIIGLSVGLVLVLLWTIVWRRALLRCAQSCCGDELEDEVEAGLMMEGGHVHGAPSAAGGGSDPAAPATGGRRTARGGQVLPLALMAPGSNQK